MTTRNRPKLFGSVDLVTLTSIAALVTAILNMIRGWKAEQDEEKKAD